MDPRSDAPRDHPSAGASVAILFAELDRPFAERFERSLVKLRDEGLITAWTEYAYSTEGAPDGRRGVPAEDVVVLLMSADLAASLLDAAATEHLLVDTWNVDALVVPVLVRPSDLGGLDIGRVPSLPRNGRPVVEWRHADDAWEDVVVGLRARLTDEARGVRRRAQWSGRVERAELNHFTVFEHASIAASPGINVFVGKNGTGKSHALKAIYALLRAPLVPDESGNFEGKLERVFKADFSTDLCRRPHARDARTDLHLTCENGRVRVGIRSPGELVGEQALDFAGSRAIFLPSREALSMYEGFTSAYERRELSFDETYYDLCKELSALPLRERAIGKLRPILDTLEATTGGTVSLAGTRFVVRSAIGEVAAHLVAEGVRKLASVAYLVRNGALTEQSILLWDEPEANLNPTLVTVVAATLRQVASLGVQVFLATHDYLLARELSLGAEYGIPPSADVRFFSFHRESDEAPVQIVSAPTFMALEHNSILDEFKAHYEREQSLFYAPERGPREAA